jgi:hypothetical protein
VEGHPVSACCARCGAPGASLAWRKLLLVCEPCEEVMTIWAINLECWVRSLLLAHEEARSNRGRGTGYY